jgi:2-alkyl-3-oxoalkanoate reductase
MLAIRQPIIDRSEPILVTGANGFIGRALTRTLLEAGFSNVRCLSRKGATKSKGENTDPVSGNLLSPGDCLRVTRDIKVVYHLAAGTGTKSYPDAFLNSVVTTRNLLDAIIAHGCIKRLVNVSSFSVYGSDPVKRGSLLNEKFPMEIQPQARDAYCYAKVKQDELVAEYGQKHALPYVFVRPGVVYGPGKQRIHGRVGLEAGPVFLHLGGSNPIPLTHIENCAEAIALAGLCDGVKSGEVFNIVDDDLPSSRSFLKMYKRSVGPLRSIYVPPFVSYALCSLWERYSQWSAGQLPPVHTRREWHAYWEKYRYSNEKLKRLLGWSPRISTADGLQAFFASWSEGRSHA